MLNLHYSFRVRDQASFLYKTVGEIILYSLTLHFYINDWKVNILNRMVTLIPRISFALYFCGCQFNFLFSSLNI